MTERRTPAADINAPIFAKPGELHWVPCIRMAKRFWGSYWVPVIGTAHIDPDLKFPHRHLHIDWRFAPIQMVGGCSRNGYGSPHGSVVFNTGTDDGAPVLTGDIVMRRMRCQRPMYDFPIMQADHWAAFEAGQRKRCARLIDGHICPHRGIDLKPFQAADGTAVCPGHGLRWDLKTGNMLRRHKATPKASEPYVKPELGEV